MLSTLFGSQTARSSFLCFCLSLYSAACGEIQRHLGRINGVIAVLSPNLQLHLHNTQAGTSKDFYPRPPRGGRLAGQNFDGNWAYISIHALREEGDPAILWCTTPGPKISIHALREEGDTIQSANIKATMISIHALREEGDCRWADVS